MAEILIIDDDLMICDILSRKVKSMGHEPTFVLTLAEGMKSALAGAFDVIFLDVRLPDGDGLGMIPTLKAARSSPEIVIMTALADNDGAELAIKNGAWDYIEKPSSINMMILPLVRALQYRETTHIKNPAPLLKRDGIIGKSAQMKACLVQVAQAARSDSNVLVTGETGTGKELMAWAIHQNSLRADKNFVVVDCASLTDTLVESMLFGYEKGAYTGADKSRDGLIRQADGGTLFLDEVGELPLSIQKSFLRVLQERRFRPLGSKIEVQSDFRLVAATNRDLDHMVLQGHFRNDLLHRLRTFTMDLPPLRNRPGDIPDLVLNHLTKLCQRYNVPARSLSPEFLESLSSYEWPGNVRELLNTVERVFVVANDELTFFAKHLPNHIRIKSAQASISRGTPRKKLLPETRGEALPRLHDLREETLINLEKNYLQKLVKHTEGRTKEACRISGLSRSRLYEILKKHEISLRQ